LSNRVREQMETAYNAVLFGLVLTVADSPTLPISCADWPMSQMIAVVTTKRLEFVVADNDPGCRCGEPNTASRAIDDILSRSEEGKDVPDGNDAEETN
jgi:hypothetical protein